MRVIETGLQGVLLVESRVFSDHRGYFMESWQRERYERLGIRGPFVQDNVSLSTRGVLRGLHLQVEPHEQAKLVTVLEGEIWDVVVDVRPRSATFGRWEAHSLRSLPLRQLYIPAGFAHGFAVLSQQALITYRCSEYYCPEAERTLLWNDPDLGINWPVADPVLSEKDRAGVRLHDLCDSLARLGGG